MARSVAGSGWWLASSPRGFVLSALLLAGLCLLGCGCAKPALLGRMTTASYEPSNVYRAETLLPPTLKRVALLPLTTLTEDAVTDFGRSTMEPLLASELGRARQFELVLVSPEELRILTGRSSWTGEEELPLDFLDKLRERLGVEGVLFSRLTQYRAYEPLAVGWRLKLMDAEEPRILWAVDEVFDARVPEVAAAARRYGQSNPDQGGQSDPSGTLTSPLRFGRYAASAVVETLPRRSRTEAD